jgi:photosystem II stability/assembly factor-like uncharacterized protein
VVHTTDGGKTWKLQESGTRRWLYSVSFADAKTGWAVGEEGLILKTNDGGENWAVQISNIPSNLLGVKAVSAKRVFAIGLNGVILQTQDGGRRWQRDASNTTTPLRAVAFAVGDGWVVGRDGVILRYSGNNSGELRTILGK